MFWSNHKYHRTGFYIGINYVALGKGNKWLLCQMNGFNSFRNRNMLFVGSVFLCSRWLVLNGNWFVHLSTDTHSYSNTWRARAGFIQWITSWLRLFLQVSVLTWFSKTLKVLNIWIRIQTAEYSWAACCCCLARSSPTALFVYCVELCDHVGFVLVKQKVQLKHITHTGQILHIRSFKISSWSSFVPDGSGSVRSEYSGESQRSFRNPELL